MRLRRASFCSASSRSVKSTAHAADERRLAVAVGDRELVHQVTAVATRCNDRFECLERVIVLLTHASFAS